MRRFAVRRALAILPVTAAVSVIVFLAMRVVPGGPLAVYTRGNVDQAAVAVIRERLGLDRPVWDQYLSWFGAAIQGDLGFSFRSNRPVLEEILARLPATLLLVGSTFVVVLVLSLIIGTYSARHQYSRADLVITTLSFAGASMPVYWLGMLIILVTGMVRNPLTDRPFLPTGGIVTPGGGGILDVAAHLILPMICLGVGWVSWYSRYVRSSLLDVIGRDYIRTARAKGVTERTIIRRHALKNAAIPIVTIVALDLPYLFAGALYTEIIFAWPGMGRFFYLSTVNRDYPIMLGIVLFLAVFVMLGNLLADLAYAWLDPRVRYGTD